MLLKKIYRLVYVKQCRNCSKWVTVEHTGNVINFYSHSQRQRSREPRRRRDTPIAQPQKGSPHLAPPWGTDGEAPHCTWQTEGLLPWGIGQVMEYQERALWAGMGQPGMSSGGHKKGGLQRNKHGKIEGWGVKAGWFPCLCPVPNPQSVLSAY